MLAAPLYVQATCNLKQLRATQPLPALGSVYPRPQKGGVKKGANMTPSAITRLKDAADNNETLTLTALENREIIAEIERLRRVLGGSVYSFLPLEPLHELHRVRSFVADIYYV